MSAVAAHTKISVPPNAASSGQGLESAAGRSSPGHTCSDQPAPPPTACVATTASRGGTASPATCWSSASATRQSSVGGARGQQRVRERGGDGRVRRVRAPPRQGGAAGSGDRSHTRVAAPGRSTWDHASARAAARCHCGGNAVSPRVPGRTPPSSGPAARRPRRVARASSPRRLSRVPSHHSRPARGGGHPGRRAARDASGEHGVVEAGQCGSGRDRRVEAALRAQHAAQAQERARANGGAGVTGQLPVLGDRHVGLPQGELGLLRVSEAGVERRAEGRRHARRHERELTPTLESRSRRPAGGSRPCRRAPRRGSAPGRRASFPAARPRPQGVRGCPRRRLRPRHPPPAARRVGRARAAVGRGANRTTRVRRSPRTT